MDRLDDLPPLGRIEVLHRLSIVPASTGYKVATVSGKIVYQLNGGSIQYLEFYLVNGLTDRMGAAVFDVTGLVDLAVDKTFQFYKPHVGKNVVVILSVDFCPHVTGIM